MNIFVYLFLHSLYQGRVSASENNEFPIRGDGAEQILITFKTRPQRRCRFNYDDANGDASAGTGAGGAARPLGAG